MKIQFLGAAGTVTGSKYLLSVDQSHFLIDCGLFQGLKEWRLKNWESLPVNPEQIQAVILTHAHLDHSGYLPVLVKNGFKGKIYTTTASKALCEILLPDAGYLQEEDAAFANKHHFLKHKPAFPLYTEEEARQTIPYIESVSWDQKIPISKDCFAIFKRAGHILGASIVQLFANGRVITFSGDLGRQKTLTVEPPKKISKTDYLVVESTYGDKLHPTEDPKETLKRFIGEAVAKKGILLIPAFAVGRAQQILFVLSQLKKSNAIPSIPIYLNSPMAQEATRIFCQFDKEQALTPTECKQMCEAAKFVSSVQESKNLNALRGPAIVIAASGMATGGRVLHHLKFLAPNPRNMIVFAGFQAAGTRGEAMIHGAKEIKIHGEQVPVRAQVKVINTLSAHADQEEIMTWLKGFSKPPKQTFITHGEINASNALKKRIELDLHWQCETPQYLQEYKLN